MAAKEKKGVLKQGHEILLRNLADGSDLAFTVKKRLSADEDAVTYRAELSGGGVGILREFFPKDYTDLRRNAFNQLVCKDETMAELFREAREEYIRPLKELLKARKEPGNEELDAFLPEFQILGSGETENAAIYSWVPGSSRASFGELCKSLEKHKDAQPVYQLAQGLLAVKSLSRGMAQLHGAGFLFRDLTPENFGFKKQGRKIMTQSAMLLDVDSICRIQDPDPRPLTGESAFRAPVKAPAACQTDIYGIGAMLSHALMIPKTEDMEKLQKLVDASPLVRAAEKEAGPQMKGTLARILRRALDMKGEGYRSCEALETDLEEALWSCPEEIAQKLIGTSAEQLKQMKGTGSATVISHHLYNHPLYENLAEGAKTLNVAVIGFQLYGQKFLDACLQAGQVIPQALRVRVLANQAKEWEDYQKERPSLKDYFELNGEKPEEESYGKLDVQTAFLPKKDEEKLKEILDQSLVEKIMDGDIPRPDYIFIALDSDEMNLSAARSLRADLEMLAENTGRKTTISFARDSLEPISEEGLEPVYMVRDQKRIFNDPEINRMAFNAHMIWEDGTDYQTAKANFLKPYNRNASISTVLSVKYKLHSLSVELVDGDFEAAAGEFTRKIGKNRWEKDRLIYEEHKRWVTEKICDGWGPMALSPDTDDLATKNNKLKQHTCLVRSKLGSPLNDFTSTAWAKDPISEKLDALDQLSLNLHRKCLERAKMLHSENVLNTGELSYLILNDRQENTSGSGGRVDSTNDPQRVYEAVSGWINSLKNIWALASRAEKEKQPVSKLRERGARLIRMAETMKTQLLEVTRKIELKKEVKEAVYRFIDEKETAFAPIMDSLRFRDFKRNDEMQIDRIPYILTYDPEQCLAIPLELGSGQVDYALAALAGPLMFDPAKVFYLTFVHKRRVWKQLKESLPRIARFLDEKHLRTKLEFVLVYTEDLRLEDDPKTFIKAAFTDLSGGEDTPKAPGRRTVEVTTIEGETTEECRDLLKAYLESQKRHGDRIALEECDITKAFNHKLIGMPDGELYKVFPVYMFNDQKTDFAKLGKGCESFRYIGRKPYLMVRDYLRLAGSEFHPVKQPDLQQCYEKLWEIYKTDEYSLAWDLICKAWKTDTDDGKKVPANLVPVTSFPRVEKGQLKKQIYTYVLPMECVKSCNKILNKLKKENLIGEPKVTPVSSESVEISIPTSKGCKSGFDTLFQNETYLLRPERLGIGDSGSIFEEPQFAWNPAGGKHGEIKVYFRSLQVKKMSLSENKDGRMIKALKTLEEQTHLLRDVEENNNKAQFTMADTRLMDLMDKEGNLLETYVFHKLMTSGRFDDVTPGIVVTRQNNESNHNEFDCVATIGLQVVVVECKAMAFANKKDSEIVKAVQEIVNKLEQLRQEYFGTGAKSATVWFKDVFHDLKDPIAEKISWNSGVEKSSYFAGADQLDHIDKELADFLEDIEKDE